MREAVDGAAEEFVVGAVTDAQVCSTGPFLVGGGIWGGERCYGRRGAIGDELRV